MIHGKEILYLWDKVSSDKCRFWNEIDAVELFFPPSVHKIEYLEVSKLI